jgi:hypothetical protein
MILTCVNHCPELVIALMTVFSSSGALVPVHAGQPDHSVSKRYSDGGYLRLCLSAFATCFKYLAATGKERWKEMRMTASIWFQKFVFLIL